MCLKELLAMRSISDIRMGGRVERLLHLCAAGLIAGSLLTAPLLSRTTDARINHSASVSSNNSSKDDAAWKGRLPITDLSEDEAITHALDRLGYGARPG